MNPDITGDPSRWDDENDALVYLVSRTKGTLKLEKMDWDECMERVRKLEQVLRETQDQLQELRNILNTRSTQ